MNPLKIRSISIEKFKGINSLALHDCGNVNALFGKNNAGKSSIIHALDVLAVAFIHNDISQFPLKLDLTDLLYDGDSFVLTCCMQDGAEAVMTYNKRNNVTFAYNNFTEKNKFTSVLIFPSSTTALVSRRSHTPAEVLRLLNARQFSNFTGLDLLFMLHYYGGRNEKGLNLDDYNMIINEIRKFFPDIEEIKADRTDQDIATIQYQEYGKKLDILYSGSGLQHFLDILIKCVVTRANVLLLDEPEQGLHPDIQRKLFAFLVDFSKRKNIQVFLSTHSPLALNNYEDMTFWKITNRSGSREAIKISPESRETLMSDIGLKPSDLFNNDVCLMVEGPDDVIFWEHVIRNLYADDFARISVGVIQYGGDSAKAITNGIGIENIVSSQKYSYWLRDKDSAVDAIPALASTQFINQLTNRGLKAEILKRREIEFYYPESLHRETQQGDQQKIADSLATLQGDQSEKFRDAAKRLHFAVPRGKNLKKLLPKHMPTKLDVPLEMRSIVNDLLQWKNEILG